MNQTELFVEPVTLDVQPIGIEQRTEVSQHTCDWIHRAGEIFEQEFKPIDICFDLKGRSAGMYYRHGKKQCIRYNPWIFAKYYRVNLEQTVPHEVAHYIVDCLWLRAKPHGPQWQKVMRAFGVEDSVTADFDLTGVPVRRQQKHAYRCACQVHEVSTVRHKRILRGVRYDCRQCKQRLVANEP